MGRTTVDEVLGRLEDERDPGFREDLSRRYGIHTDGALGVPMAKLKALAKDLGRDHGLAADLWATGVYEARMLASMIDDPAAVTPAQMDDWCAGFDNWAIVDTVCFNLFDRSPHAWSKVEQWAVSDREMTRRAAFALLWGLAMHDRAAPDDRFRAGLALVEQTAGDDRHLVNKAVGMALRAVGKRRPGLRDEALALAERLAASGDAAARRVGRPAVKELQAAAG